MAVESADDPRLSPALTTAVIALVSPSSSSSSTRAPNPWSWITRTSPAAIANASVATVNA
jgi:hypothetical protein